MLLNCFDFGRVIAVAFVVFLVVTQKLNLNMVTKEDIIRLFVFTVSLLGLVLMLVS